ncbi:MFS transporter [Clostridium uliginosum]|uniref:Predicted arabinose efflux permease, MFS family n=1 Tax=Clostridium uliginosum TaxID=119641 RepID=A0A1I1RY66_9CLOT|nr:MFS transporter [Clostridium uliginosum]SFD35580.1 Predicted arabinose efflux permease, MFS family [Clostridium uliginosum]
MGGLIINLKQNLTQYKGLPREIYILFIGRIINCIGSFVTPLMALILTQKFGMSATQSGNFIAIQACLQGLSLLLGGKLVDSFGRKKIIVICQSLGAIMLLTCGFMPISILTTKMMMASSCFYSMAMPAYDALNADVTNSENRKLSYSLLYMGVNLGFSIGPIIGGFLYKHYLPLVFILDAVTTLASMILIVMLIKEKKIVKNLEEYEEKDNLQEENQLENIVEGSVFKVLLKRPILIAFGIIMFFIEFTYAQWVFALPLQLGTLFGSDGAKLYGLLGATNGIIVIIATPFLMRLTKNTSELNNVCLSGFIYVISFLMFGFISSSTLFFFGVILMTFGEVIGATNVSTFIANNSPASHRGRISSILSIISRTGYSISPMVIGNVIDKCGISQGYIVTASSSMIAVSLIFMVNKLMLNEKVMESENNV